ncbi:hypothetical protein [Mesorhizobium sp. LSHC422A00]|uniref:hypothetical protein n=1 Tax=Mesorhizobium sp. LSHC422A00 TaxID=1287294 RepID=UPI0012EC8E76|nr:hypothetical protein [Mesorhizobium sp. LSHC422A00]
MTEDVYNEQKTHAGANGMIGKVPVGANYDDYKRNINSMKASHNESLSTAEANNLMWIGLGNGGATAYQACISALTASASGLHLTVRTATESDITLEVSWTPRGPNAPIRIRIEWDGAKPVSARLPDRISAGTAVVRVKRPSVTQSVTVQTEGDSDVVVLTPIPALIETPPPGCGAIKFSDGRYTIVQSQHGLAPPNFAILVPKCGEFTLTALLEDYPDVNQAGSQHVLKVTESLCMVDGIDANGYFYKVFIDTGGCQDPHSGKGSVYFHRGGAVRPDFMDPIFSNWAQLSTEIAERNRSFD